MTDDLETRYHAYIDVLNHQAWEELDRFVGQEVRYNGEAVGLAGYTSMLQDNFVQIPDLRFRVDLLVVTAPHLAARLWFDCHPRARFLHLPIDGRQVSFAEHVFYRFDGELIGEVWSVLDKAGIEQQLA